jgi:hypothetical protein
MNCWLIGASSFCKYGNWWLSFFFFFSLFFWDSIGLFFFFFWLIYTVYIGYLGYWCDSWEHYLRFFHSCVQIDSEGFGGDWWGFTGCIVFKILFVIFFISWLNSCVVHLRFQFLFLGSYSLEKLWWIDFLVWNVNGAAERVEERIRMTEWFSVFCGYQTYWQCFVFWK